MDKDFEIIGHTSEVGFKAYGKDIEEAFENAGKATFSIMVDLEKIEPTETVEFGIKSESLKSLLYDFLDELIYIRDVKDMVFSDFIVEIDEKDSGMKSLNCKAKGQKIGEMAGHDVKAVTYSDMEIEKKDGKSMLQVVLDV